MEKRFFGRFYRTALKTENSEDAIKESTPTFVLSLDDGWSFKFLVDDSVEADRTCGAMRLTNPQFRKLESPLYFASSTIDVPLMLPFILVHGEFSCIEEQGRE